MKIARLFIPGQFEDALIYKGMILAFTSDYRTKILNYESLVSDIASGYPQHASLLRMILAGNEALSGKQAASYLANEAVLSEVESAFDKLGIPRQVEEAERHVVLEQDISIDVKVFLDTQIYNDRLYVGTDGGCFHRDIHFRKKSAEPKGPFTRRLDTRCLAISTGFGSLNLSCGNEGLLCFSDEFDWDENINRKQKFKQISDQSTRTNWLNTDLVNYSINNSIELLRGERTESGTSSRQIVEMSSQRVPLDDVLDKVRREYDVRLEDVQYAFNSDRAMFLHTFEGNFYGIEIKRRRDRTPEARMTRSFKGREARILSAQVCKTGLVVEMIDRLLLFVDGAGHMLLEEETISVRTFPSIPQYKNLIIAVSGDGLYLISTFNEQKFRRRQESHPEWIA